MENVKHVWLIIFLDSENANQLTLIVLNIIMMACALIVQQDFGYQE
jgi:hypothetical protein